MENFRGLVTVRHRGTAWTAATFPLSTTSATLHRLPSPLSHRAVRSGYNNSAVTFGDEAIPPEF